jgi:ABC-type glycerol-3-phosphate transport system permease component
MFCDRCGANLQGPGSFCPHCGRQFGAAPPMWVGNRVSRHLRNIAILWLAYSALRLLPGLFLNSFSDWGFPFSDGAPYFVHGIVRTVGGIFLVTGIIGVIAGWGLYERRSWARILAIVLAFVNLLHPPFGTAIGIYTLWVLLPAASEAEYQRMARA